MQKESDQEICLVRLLSSLVNKHLRKTLLSSDFEGIMFNLYTCSMLWFGYLFLGKPAYYVVIQCGAEVRRTKITKGLSQINSNFHWIVFLMLSGTINILLKNYRLSPQSILESEVRVWLINFRMEEFDPSWNQYNGWWILQRCWICWACYVCQESQLSSSFV